MSIRLILEGIPYSVVDVPAGVDKKGNSTSPKTVVTFVSVVPETGKVVSYSVKCPYGTKIDMEKKISIPVKIFVANNVPYYSMDV